VRIEAVTLGPEALLTSKVLKTEDVVGLVRSEHFTWLDIEITNTTESMLQDLLVKRLDFHPATVTDCFQMTAYHQAKMEEEQNYRFITFLYYEPAGREEFTVRELNIYVGESYAITVHRHKLGALGDVISRVPKYVSEYQQSAVLFLHHVLSSISSTFAVVLQQVQRACDELEVSTLNPRRQREFSLNPFKRSDQLTDMRRILRARQAIVMLRKTLQAEQAIVQNLIGDYDYDGAPEKSEEIAIYFRDIADHMNKYLEVIESEEKTLNHLMEVHHLVSNNRTNEIITVLTVLSAIMLPLNLIVGFWGMNFDNLWWAHGHPGGIWLVVALMLATLFGLIAYFRAKQWL
jgi:magnesium transporter